MVICNLLNTFLLALSGNRQLYILLAPILEISGGVCALQQANLPSKFYKCYLMACTSFGGVSGMFQVNHILRDAHLSNKKYVFLKLISAVTTGFLTYLYLVIKEHLL